tara:strand:- start:74 stop:1024 length:951 start_codon:yes stop_codon:yes gene_type:complete
MKCSKCNKEKEESSFQVKTKTYKSCFECREQSRKWREKNKQRVADYNKFTLQKKDKKKRVIYAKKKDATEEWLEFESQSEAARELKLHTANISRVLNGKLAQTGGYIFKIEEIEKDKEYIKSWEEIKEEKNYEDLVKGKPSQKRIRHETVDNIIGKKCCSCKEWQSLEEYNLDKNRWDKLRIECKDCLKKYRKKNRRKIQDNMNKYEKARKKIDPAFKLSKTLRSRLGSALRNQSAKKRNTTMNLTGCTINFLKGYLEAKFIEGMTWENHGEWHIDHIKPCCSFNLEDDEEHKKCFHYSNLQPLWAIDNLSKSGKY